jgi:hypothetical protein
MGDGHHAWASAEVALAIRNAFVLERWMLMNRHHTLTLLGGIHQELFRGGRTQFLELDYLMLSNRRLLRPMIAVDVFPDV